MNERIREIAHEVGLPTYNPEKIPTKLEKFAELIIKECVKEIHLTDLGDLFGRDQYLDNVAKHIENHFGVDNGLF